MTFRCRKSRVPAPAAAARVSALGGMLVTLALVAPSAFAGGGSGACASHGDPISCCAAPRANCTAATAVTASAAAPTVAASAAAAPAPVFPSVSFLRAARDPETGGWTLAPLWSLSAADAAAALNQSSAGLIPVTLANGAVAVDLQGRFQSYSVARRTLDGEIETGCLDAPTSLFEWFYGLPASTPAVARTER